VGDTGLTFEQVWCREEYEHTHWRRDITDWVFRTEELKKLREIQREMEECEC
jgi:hypothetical protein